MKTTCLLSRDRTFVSPVHHPDSKAIVDGNLKLILGMIWTLILHYSISMPMWEDEDDEDAKKLTPKQRLMGWIQNKVPQLPITNFHRDWRDGKALGALVDNCAPGRLMAEGTLCWTQNVVIQLFPFSQQ